MSDAGVDPYLEWDAAYVLGALSPQERRNYEEHKAGCTRCSAAVQELAGMPGLLATAERSQVESFGADGANPVPAGVLKSLLAGARRRQRRRRVLAPVAAVLAVAATVAALFIGGILPRGSRPAQPVSLALASLQSNALKASVRLAAEPWGTRIDVSCSYDQYRGPSAQSSPQTGPGSSPSPVTPRAKFAGLSYILVITDRTGQNFDAATFWAAPGKTVWPVGGVGVPLNDIAKIQITTDKRVPLAELVR